MVSCDRCNNKVLVEEAAIQKQEENVSISTSKAQLRSYSDEEVIKWIGDPDVLNRNQVSICPMGINMHGSPDAPFSDWFRSTKLCEEVKVAYVTPAQATIPFMQETLWNNELVEVLEQRHGQEDWKNLRSIESLERPENASPGGFAISDFGKWKSWNIIHAVYPNPYDVGADKEIKSLDDARALVQKLVFDILEYSYKENKQAIVIESPLVLLLNYIRAEYSEFTKKDFKIALFMGACRGIMSFVDANPNKLNIVLVPMIHWYPDLAINV